MTDTEKLAEIRTLIKESIQLAKDNSISTEDEEDAFLFEMTFTVLEAVQRSIDGICGEYEPPRNTFTN